MKIYLTLATLLCFCLIAKGQINISGQVIDGSTNAALSGATVRLIKSQITVKTNQEGKFQISARLLSDSLELSYLGYETVKVPIQTNQHAFAIYKLVRSSEQLQEVVVSTGYQKIAKQRSTGSFEEIGSALFSRQVSTNVLERLDGVANSVLFDKRGLKNDNITVRGLSTIYAGTSPLIVLDNFPYDGNISNINPNDVESITILKDAAAAAIWGVRAGNGVIVITTKKGKLNSPLKINFNSNLTIGNKPDLYYPSRMTTSDFIDMERYLFEKGFYAGQESNAEHPPLSPVVELLIRARDKPTDKDAVDMQINSLKSRDVRNDYGEYLYRTSVLQQYAFSLNGGSDKLIYLLSSGYDQNRNNVNGDYKRLTLRSGNSYAFSKNISLDLGILYTRTRSALGNSPYNTINFGSGKPLYPYAKLIDEVGNPLSVEKDYRSSFKREAEGKGLLDWSYKPLEELAFNNNVTQQSDLLINTGLNYIFLKNFKAELKYQFENTSTTGRNLKSQNAYEIRDLINRYTQVNADMTLSRPIPLGDVLMLTTNAMNSQSLRGQLNYNYADDVHDLNVIIGSEIKENHFTGNSGQTYGYNDNLLTTTRVDYANTFPLFNGNSARIPDATSYRDVTNRLRSYYINGAYSYRGRYTLSASARQDGSNLFGVKSNQKLVPLWSAGLAWNLSKEAFYTSDILPYLKLRATYGFNGNMNNNLSALTTIMYASGNLVNLPYAYVANAPNPSLRWEKIKVINIGVDFATQNDRIGGSLEYYSKNGVDLLGRMALDQTTGALNPNMTFEYTGNSASMTSRGVDVQLRTINVNQGFKWVSDINFSYASNKLTGYNSVVTDPRLYINNGYVINPIIGKPLYSIFSYKWAGLDPINGDPMGYLGGQISKDYNSILNTTKADELTYNGSAMPTKFGSLRNTFSWKGLSLSANITFRLGYYFVRNSVNYSALFTNYVSHGDYGLRWQKPGDEKNTDVLSLVYPNNPERDSFYSQSSNLVERGDHLRLQDINLSYTISNNQWHRLPIRSIQPYLYINNIGILWRANKQGLDPDYVVGLPTPRTFSFGLRVEL